VNSWSAVPMEDLMPFRIGSDTWRVDFDSVRAPAVTRLAFLEISAPENGSLASYIRVRFHTGRRLKRGGAKSLRIYEPMSWSTTDQGGNAPQTTQALSASLRVKSHFADEGICPPGDNDGRDESRRTWGLSGRRIVEGMLRRRKGRAGHAGARILQTWEDA
jgi:hypothetical protein